MMSGNSRVIFSFYKEVNDDSVTSYKKEQLKLYKDKLIKEYDLFAFEDVKKLNVFSRLMKSINFLIWGDV